MIKHYLIEYTGNVSEVKQQEVTGMNYISAIESGGSFKIKCTEKELDEKVNQWNKLSSFFVKEIHDLTYSQIGIYLYSEHTEEPSIYEVVNITENCSTRKKATISEIVNFLKDAGSNHYEIEDYKDFLTSEKKNFYCGVYTDKLKVFLSKESKHLKDYYNNF